MQAKRRDLIKILIAIYCFFTAMGINIVVFPVILKSNNVTETFIGISVICELLAGLVFAHQIIKLLKQHGAKSFIKTTTFLYAGVMLLIGNYINYFIWLGLVILVGAYWYGFSLIKQSWYNTIIPDEKRNILISLNTMVLSLGFASGSYIVSVLGSLNSYNLFLAMILAALAYLSISSIETKLPEIKDTVSYHVAGFVKEQPLLYFAKFTQEVTSISVLSFIVIYAINIGLTAEQGAMLAGCYTLSAILNLLAAGILDRFYHKIVFLCASLGMILSLFGIFYFEHDVFLLAVLSFASGFLASFYYIGCEAEINMFFKKDRRVGANNALSFVTNLGGIFGCLLTGFLMYHIGNIGFILPSVLGHGIIVLCLLKSIMASRV